MWILHDITVLLTKIVNEKCKVLACGDNEVNQMAFKYYRALSINPSTFKYNSKSKEVLRVLNVVRCTCLNLIDIIYKQQIYK